MVYMFAFRISELNGHVFKFKRQTLINQELNIGNVNHKLCSF